MASLKNNTGLDDDVLFGRSRVGRLMGGDREEIRIDNRHSLLLFWETWTEQHEDSDSRSYHVPVHGYVVAEGPLNRQHRFSTLREATEKMGELQDKYAAQIAAYALGIR